MISFPLLRGVFFRVDDVFSEKSTKFHVSIGFSIIFPNEEESADFFFCAGSAPLMVSGVISSKFSFIVSDQCTLPVTKTLELIVASINSCCYYWGLVYYFKTIWNKMTFYLLRNYLLQCFHWLQIISGNY